MRTLWIEDDKIDIYGMEAQCEARGWQKDVVDNFCDAVKILATRDNKFDVVIIDLMLPWGTEVTDWILQNYSEEMAGLKLLEAMRGCGEGQFILDKIGLPCLHERYDQTPVVILSKFPEREEACRKLDIVQFFCKRNYSWEALVAAIEGFAHG